MTKRRKRKKSKKTSTRLTKLHRRLRKQLGLTKLGFRSEKPIGPFRVDELNEKKKLIVEIHGDNVHGNPRKFNADQKTLYGMKAEEKWEKDASRQEYLESLGYTVVVVWESDNLRTKLDVIKHYLR